MLVAATVLGLWFGLAAPEVSPVLPVGTGATVQLVDVGGSADGGGRGDGGDRGRGRR